LIFDQDRLLAGLGILTFGRFFRIGGRVESCHWICIVAAFILHFVPLKIKIRPALKFHTGHLPLSTVCSPQKATVFLRIYQRT